MDNLYCLNSSHLISSHLATPPKNFSILYVNHRIRLMKLSKNKGITVLDRYKG